MIKLVRYRFDGCPKLVRKKLHRKARVKLEKWFLYDGCFCYWLQWLQRGLTFSQVVLLIGC
jgi:hypothetical protein